MPPIHSVHWPWQNQLSKPNHISQEWEFLSNFIKFALFRGVARIFWRYYMHLTFQTKIKFPSSVQYRVHGLWQSIDSKMLLQKQHSQPFAGHLQIRTNKQGSRVSKNSIGLLKPRSGGTAPSRLENLNIYYNSQKLNRLLYFQCYNYIIGTHEIKLVYI